jgi:hypothetical protein
MKVLVKDIHQWKQEFEVAPSDPISSLKEKIMEERGLKDYLIKLIYKGKQLASESTFESYNIQDQELIIMLQTPISTQSNSAKAAGNIGDSNEEVIISKEPEAPTSTTAELEDSAEKLRTMGFPEHQIFPALKAAFGDANRAVEYLTNGLPENCMESFQDEDTKQAQPTLNLQPDTRHLSNPEFLRIIHNIQENPQILEPLLISIGRTNPDFLRVFTFSVNFFLITEPVARLSTATRKTSSVSLMIHRLEAPPGWLLPLKMPAGLLLRSLSRRRKKRLSTGCAISVLTSERQWKLILPAIRMKSWLQTIYSTRNCNDRNSH